MWRNLGRTFGLDPGFGRNPDGWGQHYVALQYIRDYQHKIVSGIANGTLFQIPHFWYTLGQGADLLTTLNAYDFLDPISWISVALFPNRLTRSYKLMIWIKIFLSGEAFCLYSNYVKKADSWRTAMGGLLYSFFNIEYFFYFPNFMHGCYLFPVILWSIEVLMKENRNQIMEVALGIIWSGRTQKPIDFSITLL